MNTSLVTDSGAERFILYRGRIIDLAAQHHLPAMYGTSEFIDAGGLMFYGPSLRANFRRAAVYVDISKYVGPVKSLLLAA